jgi:ribosomal protein S18 acetylase RimI-like enzyme
VPKDDTRTLRHRVLRPHERLADVGGAGGDEPDAGYFAVREPRANANANADTDTDTDANANANANADTDTDTDADTDAKTNADTDAKTNANAAGTVIGTVAVLREPHPTLAFDHATTWRIRGMATAEGYRNLGIGAALMTAALAHAADHGGRTVWCNARVPALSFYRRAGFATVGDAWDEPDIGPHVVMWRSIP